VVLHRGTWRREDSGVASSLGTMLAILVILALVTMITTSWAPQWTKGKESEHMRTVESQFSNLKALMDQLVLSGNVNVVVSSPITLGSGGVPLFSGEATGNISLLSSNSNSYNTFSVTNSTGRFERTAYGSISYTSHNTEWIDQTFLYECGSIIVRQSDGQLVTTGPGMLVQNVRGKTSISMTLVSVYSDGSSYTGAGTIGVQCHLVSQKISDAKAWVNGETIRIIVTSAVYHAWYNYFVKATTHDWGLAPSAYTISEDSVAKSTILTLNNVISLTTDYVMVGASLDLS
jgi:hypothetical protein